MRALHVFPLLWFVSGFALARTTAAQLSTDQAAAQEFVETGEQALREGRPGDALRAYKDAYARRPTRLYACNVGRLALRLERWADAAEHLELCVRNAPPPTLPEEQQERAKEADELTKAKASVSRLEIEASLGAAVFVDDQHVGIAPLSRAIYVDPGLRRIVVKMGTTELQRIVAVSPGKVTQVSLKPPPAFLPPPPPLPPLPSPRSHLTPIVIGVVSGAGFIGSGVAIGAAQVQWDASERGYNEAYRKSSSGCAQAQGNSECGTYLQKGIEATTLHNAAIGGFIASGIGGVVALALFVAHSGDGGGSGVRVGTNGTSIEVSGVW